MIKRTIPVVLLFDIILVIHVCLAKNTNGTTVDRSGLTGAIPREDLVYRTAIVCEGQKLYIDCPNIYHRIQVQSSFYGREDATTCKHPDLPSDKICAEQNTTVKNVVMDLCQGESKCEIAATNDFLAQLGTIICPNVYKYLYVKYRCVPKTALRDAPGLSPYEHTTSVTSTVTTNYAPLQCCYVVPGLGTSQTATTVGGTIVRHKEGVQSVEERIVSERPRYQPTNKVTEIIQSHPTQIQSSVKQLENIPLARISVLPGTSRLQLNTLAQGGAKMVGTHVVTVGSPQIRGKIGGQQKKEVIRRPFLSENNQGAEQTGTHEIYEGSPQIRRSMKDLQKKEVITRPFLSIKDKRHFVAGKISTHEATVGSPRITDDIKGLQRKGVITRPFLSPKTKRILIKNKLKRPRR